MKKEKKIKKSKVKEVEEKNAEKIEEKVEDITKREQIQQIEAKKRKAPLGIKIISIIYYIASFLYLAIAIVAFFKQDIISELSKLELLPVMNSDTIIIFGIFFLLLSILSFFIARGLLKFQMWARIALLGICALNIVGGIFSILEGNYLSAINLLFNLIIACYLIFSRKVKEAFSQKF